MTFELILDVAIGLVLIFALFSLLASTIVELISAMLRRRGRMQEYGIAQLLDGEVLPRKWGSRYFGGRAFVALPGATKSTLTERFYELEPIKALMDKERLPTYVSADAFVTAVMSLIHEDLKIESPDPDYGAAARMNTSGSKLAKIINELFPNQSVTRAALEKRLRVYYKDATDRIIGWYARETQIWLLAVGALIAITFNVNTIYMADELSTNANMRAQLVAAAESDAEIAALAARAQAQGDGAGGANYKDIVEQKRKEVKEINDKISSLSLPIGRCRPFAGSMKDGRGSRATASGATFDLDSLRPDSKPTGSCAKSGANAEYGGHLTGEIVGWVLTAFAISLGAPFWFDLLSKLVAIRRAGKLKKEKDEKEEEPSEAAALKTPPSGGGRTGDEAPGAMALDETERELLSKDDIKNIQRIVGAPKIDGDLASAVTRQAIKAWKSTHADLAPDGRLRKLDVVRMFNEGIAAT